MRGHDRPEPKAARDCRKESGCQIRVAARCQREPAAATLAPCPMPCSTTATSPRVRHRLRLVQRQRMPGSPPCDVRLLPSGGREIWWTVEAETEAARPGCCPSRSQSVQPTPASGKSRSRDRQERRNSDDEDNHRYCGLPGGSRRTSPLLAGGRRAGYEEAPTFGSFTTSVQCEGVGIVARTQHRRGVTLPALAQRRDTGTGQAIAGNGGSAGWRWYR